MEQILAFVLGVSAVAFLWVVVVAFKTSKLAKQNKESIRNIEEWISRNDEMVNRRIDQEIGRTDRLYYDTVQYIDNNLAKEKSKKKLLKG